MVFQKFDFAMSARSFRTKRPGGLIIVVVPLGKIGCRSLSLIPDYSREVRLNVRLTKVKGLKHNRTSWDFEAILSISCRGAYFQTISRFSKWDTWLRQSDLSSASPKPAGAAPNRRLNRYLRD